MQSQRGRAIALAALLVVSALVSGVGAVQAQSTTDEEDTPEPADHIYVSETGDAVLVYESTDATDSAAPFGVDVRSGLIYARVHNTSGSEQIDANMTAVVTPRRLTADGRMSAPKPPSLTGLAVNISSRSTETVSRADMDLSATYQLSSPYAGFINTVTTNGTVTTTASRLQATAKLDAELAVSVPPARSQIYDLQVTESDNVYTVTVAENRTVSRFATERWHNRSAAVATLEDRYAGTNAPGNVSVTLDSYAFDNQSNRGGRLHITYTVTVSNITPTLERALTTNPQFSATQAQQISQAVANSTINELSLNYQLQGDTATAALRVDVRGYSDLALALQQLQAVQADQDAQAFVPNVTRIRKQVAAQQAANLQTQFTWNGSATLNGTTATLALDTQRRSDNWAAYIDALEARGVSVPTSQVQLIGTIAGDRIVVNGSADIRGEDLLARLSPSTGSLAANESGAALLAAVSEANLRKAKLDVTYGADGLTMQAGAAFADLTPMRDLLANQSAAPAFGELVGRTEEGTTTTYVRVPSTVSGDVTETKVRALAYVNDTTTIHMPGDWNRTFPTMDTDRARTFLNLQSNTGGNTTSGNATSPASTTTAPGSSGPGFGIVGLLVALLAVLVVGTRDR